MSMSGSTTLTRAKKKQRFVESAWSRPVVTRRRQIRLRKSSIRSQLKMCLQCSFQPPEDFFFLWKLQASVKIRPLALNSRYLCYPHTTSVFLSRLGKHLSPAHLDRQQTNTLSAFGPKRRVFDKQPKHQPPIGNRPTLRLLKVHRVSSQLFSDLAP